MKRRRLDSQIVAVARGLAERGLVVGTVGNVSARCGEQVRITPTRTPYARMRPKDLVTLDLDADEADRRASLEWPLHTAIYRRRDDVLAVVHAHAPWSIAWSGLHEPLPQFEESTYYRIGVVSTSCAGAAGSWELATDVSERLGRSKAVLLHRHGVVAIGATPREALTIAEVIEHQAQVAWLLRLGAMT